MGNTMRALRLTFIKRGEELALHSVVEVDALVPPGDRTTERDLHGVWIELRDGRDQSYFRRILHEQLREDTEIFSPNAAASITRIPETRPETVFSVLVPNVPEADHVALFSSLHDSARIDANRIRLANVSKAAGPFSGKPAKMIGRFALKQP